MHLVAGNHDNPGTVIARLGDTLYLDHGVSPSRVVEYPQAWVDRTLGARPQVPAFVCLHHPPLPVEIPFFDDMILTDAAALAEVITRHPHVARVPAGRVHRDVSAPFPGALMTAAPNTYQQSALCLHDAEPPASPPTRPASCCTCSTEPDA